MVDPAAVNGSIDNVNVLAQELLPTPEEIHARLPLTDQARETVLAGRRQVEQILDRRDPRVFLVVGPCSIHDTAAARDYARRLKRLADEVSDSVFVIMRVYFEKPRTTVGWKGFINDPHMDDSFRIDEGLYNARQLLLEFAEMGLPTATEALDPITPQYISDLITWTAIGARTTESQTHREMASGLSTPVGFKNGTDGNLTTAINALHSVANPHSFLGINYQGQCSIIRTRGNAYGHLVLRGGGGKPNYDSVSVSVCEKELAEAGLPANIAVDCSHANCNKDPALQPLVLDNLVNQITEGNRSLVGMMVESNIGWGNQKLGDDVSTLEYGVSVTDPCIDWETTEQAVRDMAERLQPVLSRRMEC
ncbi:3-deoxy-7-phosphoheptulonate synthase [Aquisalimonas sp. 2447]|uniref:3-deoxy-7-phosphoheptulonate synthase n=1 Tax=Aquisalimonas sp. 2447 TaxID=2740807 RepID=UPI0014325552|nr:3-deoxy-7-phosphoheptulonate synthase [Aquisalimonas sp. 2447]QIT56435.1 3-deoxy-7-phosphoheptulonate synthase [Aquisalimonas sp. 2447]